MVNTLDTMLRRLKKRLDDLHPGSTLPHQIVGTIHDALMCAEPPLSVALRALQPTTQLELGDFLRRHGFNPDEFE